jgi:hypothetical protein
MFHVNNGTLLGEAFDYRFISINIQRIRKVKLTVNLNILSTFNRIYSFLLE